MKLSMTQVNVVALLVLCLLVLLVYFERESINTFSATLHHLGIVAGGLIAIWVAIWRGVVADRQAEASQQQTRNIAARSIERALPEGRRHAR